MKSSVANPSSPADKQASYAPYVYNGNGSRFNAPSRLPGFRQQPPPAAAPTRRRRIALAPEEGWLALVLLAVAIYSVVYSIIYANWVDHTFILLWSAPAGLLGGLLVAKMRRIPQAVFHIAACLVGYWLSVWLTSVVALHMPWTALLDSLRSVISGGLGDSAAGSEMVFLFYLTFLCFFLGYLGSWLIYRAHLPWLVALAYCAIMLVNLNYTKQDLSVLVVILLGALILLIARIHLVAQLERWKSEGLYTDRPWLRAIVGRFMQIASMLMLLVLLVGWLFPVLQQPGWGVGLWNGLDNAMTNIAHRHISFQNPGSILFPYQAPTNFFGDQLTVSGSVNLPTGEVLSYTSTAAPQYLEGNTLDRFDGHTKWTSAISSEGQAFAADAHLPLDATDGVYTQGVTSVTVLQPIEGTRNYIFAPAQPISFNVPTTVYGRDVATAWAQQTPLSKGERYTVASAIPNMSIEQLSRAALPQQDPTAWLNDPNYAFLETYYLHLPDLPPTILRTARAWTSGAQNTYQAMMDLQAHLSDPAQFVYSVNNEPIPDNVDIVSWLLQTRRGYCTYYASAMVVMARELGVPARMANGFSQGHYDPHRQQWVVNGDDAHSWVQVYFPGQGWVNFDPTPGFALNPAQNNTPGSQPTVTSPSTQPSATANPARNRRSTQQPGTTGNNPSSSTGSLNGQGVLLGFTLLTLLGSILFLFIALGIHWWRNLYRQASFVSGAYWRLCRLASWAGFAPKPWQTPYEYSYSLSQNIPHATSPLRRLTDLFVRDRWAAPYEAPRPGEESDVERLWPHLRKPLLQLFLRRFRKS